MFASGLIPSRGPRPAVLSVLPAKSATFWAGVLPVLNRAEVAQDSCESILGSPLVLLTYCAKSEIISNQLPCCFKTTPSTTSSLCLPPSLPWRNSKLVSPWLSSISSHLNGFRTRYSYETWLFLKVTTYFLPS